MDEWTLNDLLECSVCLERLDTSSKVLPCQHTFCKKCLQEIVHTHKELRCPECRVKVEVGIDDLPPNVLLMRILEGMRNAPRKNVTHPHQNQISTSDTVKLNVSKFSSPHSRMRSRSGSRQVTQISDIHQPYAIAKCECVAKEPGDLSFKRGDVILLRKKIEHNWYQGECNGVLGVFSLSYVQVMVPLPSHIPQCKALYDFNKCHEDDEGCLHFSKGDVITVTRRIDENWAEGKIEDRIGIFPTSFVEMNYLAKSLMKISFQPYLGLSRDAPPTPTDESVPLLSNDTTTSPSSTTQHNTSAETVSSPSSSSSSTSTATTSPTSSSESTTLSSPSTSPSSNQPVESVTAKRHSFTLGAHPPPYHAPPAVHRHSAEILKPEESVVSDIVEPNQRHQLEHHAAQAKPMRLSAQLLHQSQATQLHEESPNRQYHRKKQSQNEQSDANREASLCLSTKQQINGNVIGNLQRQGSLRITKNSAMHSKSSGTPMLPAMYIAIYPYKPQKTDELELKIGSVYTVIERCQDGWYKGTSHPNQKCGVFPGNYVTPVKSLPVLQAQLRGLVHNSPKLDVRACSEIRVPTSSAKPNIFPSSTLVCQNNGNITRLDPPELPARAISPALVSTGQKNSTAVWHIQNLATNQEKSVTSTSTKKTKPGIVECESGSSNNVGQKCNESKICRSADKNKDKREKCSVSLMRRLTSMKKSKSPPPPTFSYSIDNPVFEDGSSPVFVPVVHARSDSCPSQLSYNTPSHATSSTNNHSNIAGGSQRLKHKQRSSLQNQSRTYETNLSNFSANTNSNKVTGEEPIINHRKSSSLDTTLYDERQLHKTKQFIPPSLERYRCIAPYPPNSEFELELRYGDIIYVHKKRDDGWYKGTLIRNSRTGLFPANFVERM